MLSTLNSVQIFSHANLPTGTVLPRLSTFLHTTARITYISFLDLPRSSTLSVRCSPDSAILYVIPGRVRDCHIRYQSGFGGEVIISSAIRHLQNLAKRCRLTQSPSNLLIAPEQLFASQVLEVLKAPWAPGICLAESTSWLVAPPEERT